MQCPRFSAALISSQLRRTPAAVPADGGVYVRVVAGGARSLFAKDVRMAANQLAVQALQHVRDREMAFVGRHLRIKEHLQKQIAKLFGKMVEVAALDGVEDLVDLFQRVFANGIEGLLAIPRAAAGSAQPGHDGRGLLKQCRRPRRIGDGLRAWDLSRWFSLAADPSISILPFRERRR